MLTRITMPRLRRPKSDALAHAEPRPRAHLCALGLLCAIVVLFTACGNGQGTTVQRPFQPKFVEAVTFKADVAYDSALSIVTDLGLQPAIDCGTSQAGYVVRWTPMGQRADYPQTHRLFVSPVAVPSDWLERLQSARAVAGLADGVPQFPDSATPVGYHTGAVAYHCEAPLLASTAPPDLPVPLTAAQAGTYARVTFDTSLVSYNSALYAVSNSGLALAHPCVDGAEPHGTPQPWQPVGQETSFAATHALTVVTTKRFTSNQWQQQVRDIPGVRSVLTPYPASC